MILRRNPRLEWIARNRLHKDHEWVCAPRGTSLTGPNGILRKFPHDIKFTGPNGIKRIDRLGGSQTSSHTASRTTDEKATPLPLVVIEYPSSYIGVILDAPDGKLTEHDKDLLGFAHQLKQSQHQKVDHDSERQAVAVVAIIVSPYVDSNELIQHLQLAGADRYVDLAPNDESYLPEHTAESVSKLEKQVNFQHLCFADTPLMGADVGRRVAAKLGLRPTPGVWKYKDNQLICRGAAGKTDITRPLSKVIIALAQCAEPIDEQQHQCIALASDIQNSMTTHITDLGNAEVNPNDINLSEASFILSGGNGIADWDNFHKAAELLGATEGASRVAVDNGHMPRERQVGATGTWVSAKVYIAVGISGAVQHMQGIGQCEKIIAINTDESCDMVKRADLSVIIDSDTVLSALISALDESANLAQPVHF